MTFEEIQAMWEQDSKIDPVELQNVEKKNYLRIKTSGQIDFEKQIYLYNLNETGKPGFEVINLGHFFIIIAALLFALRQIISRLLAATDDPVTTAFFTAYTSVFIFLLFQPWVWTPITNTNHIFLFFIYAACAGTAEFLVIKSLQIAHAVVVSPLQYTLLIWVTIFGFVIWGIFPDFWTFMGAGVIIATGLYSLHRERLKNRVEDNFS